MNTRLRNTLAVLLGLVLVCLVTGFIAHEKRPERGRTGADAEALTRYFEDAAGGDAWSRTGAVSFRFLGGHRYLWDRERDFVRVSFRDYEVQIPLNGGTAIVREDGRDVRDADDRRELRERAYRYFLNDTFWLNPFEHLRDPGTVRSVIRRGGRDVLLVEFTSGGMTPGDAYVFMPRVPGENPMRWAMWVSALPIGGVENTWEFWQTLSTGAKVSRWHAKSGLGFVFIEDAEGAATLRDLVGPTDPFADLVRANPPR